MRKPTRGTFRRTMGGSALKRTRKRKFQLSGRSSSQRLENKNSHSVPDFSKTRISSEWK